MYRLLPLLLVALVLTAGAGAARPILGQPFDLAALPGGTFLVSDLTGNAVNAVSPGTKSGRRVARITQARELERLPDGRVLVTSRARVLALNVRTGKTTPYATAQGYLLGIAYSKDGWLYASENTIGSEETDVVRIRGGQREVLVEDLRGVHGLVVTSEGLVILSESYAGRVLRLDPETKEVTVLATGLGNPSFSLPAAGGGYFVSEFTGNRISRIWPDGRVTKVADVGRPGAIVFDSLRRITGITQSGTLFRVVRGKVQTIYS